MNNLIVRTPLIRYQNSQIFLKPENLQPFGSYKIRGVSSAVQAASPEILKNGLFAASAGNMAQAVAYMAWQRSIQCRIFVPDTAPAVKKDAIKKLGAQLIELPFAQVWDMVRTPPKNFEGLFIHPVFTPGLLEGYGTIGEELLLDLPHLDAVVIPFGVGGLTIGIAERLKKLKSDLLIYTCEPETAAPLKASLSAGRPTSVQRTPSFVDAIGTPEVLPDVFRQVQNLVKDSIVVSLVEVRSAMNELMLKHKLICEGAAGASLAASLKLSQQNPDVKIACILSGGNTPLEFMT